MGQKPQKRHYDNIYVSIMGLFIHSITFTAKWIKGFSFCAALWGKRRKNIITSQDVESSSTAKKDLNYKYV